MGRTLGGLTEEPRVWVGVGETGKFCGALCFTERTAGKVQGPVHGEGWDLLTERQAEAPGPCFPIDL